VESIRSINIYLPLNVYPLRKEDLYQTDIMWVIFNFNLLLCYCYCCYYYCYHCYYYYFYYYGR